MINTVLFDLDGTLLQFSQDEFIGVYFAELKKVFTRIGLDAEAAAKAVWLGTKAMVLNDGSKPNSKAFWNTFSRAMNLSGNVLKDVEAVCDLFYSNEFDSVKSVLKNADTGQPGRIIRNLTFKGYTAALATNPVFPAEAVKTRLAWIGLRTRDFKLITDYSNSFYCKPNPKYYGEILTALGREPEQCLMVGNNVNEDMCAGALGMETYLVTGHIINEAGWDISGYRRGSMDDLEKYLSDLPQIS